MLMRMEKEYLYIKMFDFILKSKKEELISTFPKCKYGYNAFKGKCNEKSVNKRPEKAWIFGEPNK